MHPSLPKRQLSWWFSLDCDCNCASLPCFDSRATTSPRACPWSDTVMIRSDSLVCTVFCIWLSHRWASSADWSPSAAAVMACQYQLSVTSSAANTPGKDVCLVTKALLSWSWTSHLLSYSNASPIRLVLGVAPIIRNTPSQGKTTALSPLTVPMIWASVNSSCACISHLVATYRVRISILSISNFSWLSVISRQPHQMQHLRHPRPKPFYHGTRFNHRWHNYVSKLYNTGVKIMYSTVHDTINTSLGPTGVEN